MASPTIRPSRRAVHSRDGPAPARLDAGGAREARARRGGPRARFRALVAARALPRAGRRAGAARVRPARAKRRAVPLAQRRLPRLRGFPGRPLPRQAQEDPAGAQARRRRGGDAAARDRARGDAIGLGLLQPLLPQDPSRAPLDAVSHAGILRRAGAPHAGQRARDRRARGGLIAAARSLRGRGAPTAATGARSSTFRACTSRRATRRSSSASGGIALFAARRASTSTRARLPARTTRSFRRLAHPAFNRAVDEFLAREGEHIGAYVDELNERNPYRR